MSEPTRTERPGIGLCWGTVRQADLAQLIEGAARHGMPTIQICPELYAGWRDSGRDDRALRRQLGDAGVRVRLIDGVSGGLPGVSPDPMMFKGQPMVRHDISTCARVAEAVEAPLINLSPYGGKPVPFNEMADAIGAISRRAAASGAAITLEGIPESTFESIGGALDVARACGESNCFVLLDIWHLTRSGGGVADVQAFPAGMIGAIQISDRKEPAPGSAYMPMSGRMLPGEGELPLDELVDAALVNNPELTIEIEVFSEELEVLPVDAAFARIASSIQAWGPT